MLLRDDHINALDRIVALEKLNLAENARTKKDLVEEALELFFRSQQAQPRT